MDLSRGHFYKTIEEAETTIKQYFKEVERTLFNSSDSSPTNNIFFINQKSSPFPPPRIQKNIRRDSPLMNKKNDSSRRIKIFLFVGNHPPTTKKNHIRRESSLMNKYNCYSSGFHTNNDDHLLN